jgi:hypothetical protein
MEVAVGLEPTKTGFAGRSLSQSGSAPLWETCYAPHLG